MEYAEMIRRLAVENQTRKILAMIKECSDFKEAVKKIEDLLYEITEEPENLEREIEETRKRLNG